jgi:hypothetical protein
MMTATSGSTARARLTCSSRELLCAPTLATVVRQTGRSADSASAAASITPGVSYAWSTPRPVAVESPSIAREMALPV